MKSVAKNRKSVSDNMKSVAKNRKSVSDNRKSVAENRKSVSDRETDTSAIMTCAAPAGYSASTFAMCSIRSTTLLE